MTWSQCGGTCRCLVRQSQIHGAKPQAFRSNSVLYLHLVFGLCPPGTYFSVLYRRFRTRLGLVPACLLWRSIDPN